MALEIHLHIAIGKLFYVSKFKIRKRGIFSHATIGCYINIRKLIGWIWSTLLSGTWNELDWMALFWFMNDRLRSNVWWYFLCYVLVLSVFMRTLSVFKIDVIFDFFDPKIPLAPVSAMFDRRMSSCHHHVIFINN